MNSKRTNRLVAILNLIAVASIFILEFSTSYLLSSMMTGENGGRSIYGNFIIDFLLNHIQPIMGVVAGGVGILNIICAIQNKENKKLLFWQLVFGLSEIYSTISIALAQTDIDFLEEWGSKIAFGIIPIILVIIYFIRIRKNKPKVIQIISYVIAIILSILDILDILGTHWEIIAIVMQFIYIHYQDKYIEESNSRKIVNIILYYILEIFISLGFIIMILYSLLTTKVNEIIWDNELSNLTNTVTSLQGATVEDVYIPVEKNYKYGFINESGQEKINCEYDRVTYFNEIEINNSNYYIALAKKDNDYYIITKSNDAIKLEKHLKKYMEKIYEHFNEFMVKQFNINGDYRNAYIQSFEFFLQCITNGKLKLNQQVVNKNDNENSVTSTEKNSIYYFNGKNYSMKIEPLYDDTEKDDESLNTDDEDYIGSNEKKYRVTVTKLNGETDSNVVYLPGIDEYDSNVTLNTFSNGFIQFEDENQTINGWFDNYGNTTTIPKKYDIQDIKNDKIILKVSDENEDENYDINSKTELNYIIISMSGNTLLKTTAIDIYENIYLVKNDNNKMVLMDEDLNTISNEYDKIITTIQMDISPNFSSYY